MKTKNFMGLTLILWLVSLLGIQGYIFAQEKVSLEDKIIGSTFKSLAKAFIATTDFTKLKKDGLLKLSRMDEKKFEERYAKVYQAVKDLPPQLKAEYKVREHKTKEEAIKDIESLDKKKAYKAIDSIPDTIIAHNFREYLMKKKQELQKSNLAEQVNAIWAKIVKKVENTQSQKLN